MSANVNFGSLGVGNSPVQWLVANQVGGNSRPQIIPNESWTPIHLGGDVLDSTTGRPQEGATSENILNSPSLTPAGSQTIEIQAGGIANLNLSPTTVPDVRFLVIEDTTNNECQVVQYTGTSAGTGTGGRDEITGVTRGSWSITGGTRYNIREAAVEVIARRPDAAINGYYLSNLEATVAFEGNTTGVRQVRMVTYTDFLGIPLEYPPFTGSTVPGVSGISGVQTVNEYFQPGYGYGGDGVSMIQVYQSSGGDLALAANGPLGTLPAYTCVFQCWLPTPPQ